MKKYILFNILSLLLLSCNREKGKIELAITNEIENCNTSNCTISLKKITSFKWDKVYFFETPSSKEFIEKNIGIDYSNYVEFTRPIIFLNQGKIIYYENNNASIEGLTNEQIVIGDIIDTVKVRVFTPDEAFLMERLKKIII